MEWLVLSTDALSNSVDDRFLLRVVTPDRPATFPGPRLPRKGAHATVDRLANPDDAWAIHVRRGTTYRLNFVSSGPPRGAQTA